MVENILPRKRSSLTPSTAQRRTHTHENNTSALFKEGGTYYLSIKKDGVTNQIYSITDLNQAQNPNAWTRVNDNVITGYEGPSLTKYKGKYFMYTDKLKDYPYGHADGKAGEFVTKSTNLRSGWTAPKRITTKSQNGANIPNRHGSVITVTDPAAKAVIWNLARSFGYSDDSNEADDLYTDVDSSTSHAQDIVWLSKQGITKGYPDGSFGVGVAVFRQDMAAFLYRMAGSPAYTPSAEDQARFTDVNANTSHAKEIWWLASTGITKGYPNGTFGVGVPVYRQDMAAFLKRYADQFGGPAASGAGKTFTDVNASTAHAEDIAWLSKTGVTNGYPNGSFGVGVKVYRQDMAAFLHRMSVK
ncbi:S-layer homology domain-containing protein [Bifidobacterium miconisargentati]|uniref:S-layer homology domain-containing protein n=1 Tax=Bifidobacterium miconisargentati TaxID=2834437 RepID=UPI001BDD1194|nr:S-layer homology domain-containing protein [Bifidobacterium miconisargentati]MBW3091129.1 S-layer homology domain-containing protein [Bifidobacterium miconisargentati]